MIHGIDPSEGQQQELEKDLISEARQIALTVPSPVLVSALVESHVQRQRAARLRRRTMSIAVSSVLLLGSTVAFHESEAFRLSLIRSGSPATGRTDVVAKDIGAARNGAEAAVADSGESRFVLTGQPNDPLLSLESLPTEPMSVWILTVDANGHATKVPGIYLPGRMHTVPLDELSPPVRRAARMLLGMEEVESDLDSI